MSAVGAECLWLGAMKARTLPSRAAAVIALLGLPLLFVQPASGQIPCAYEVAAIVQAPPGPIGDSPTFPTAISSNGQHVVGWFNYDAVGSARPWYWSQSTGFVALPLPPGFSDATPSDINNSRVVCGSGFTGGMGMRGYVYDMSSGQFTILQPLPDGSWSGANAINDAGVVCGFRSVGPGTIPRSAFIWSPDGGGTFTDLGVMSGPNSEALAISPNGTVVGFTGLSSGSSNSIGFVHENGTTTLLGPVPGGFTSVARDISVDGRLVVTGRVYAGTGYIVRAFIVTGNDWLELLPLDGDTYTVAADITTHSTVVGVSRLPGTGAPVDQPVVWLSSEPVAIADRVVLPRDVEIEGPTDVSDSGMVVVIGSVDGDIAAIILRPTSITEGDTDCNGLVNVVDLLNVITSWGPCEGCSEDFDQNDTVGVVDLLTVINHWTP